MKIYEACVGNYKEALLAFEKGADRIELCDNLMEDGTTPSYGTIKKDCREIKHSCNGYYKTPRWKFYI